MSVKQLMMICLSALAMACAPKEPVKYLALSFDDGPNLTTESRMLEVLAKHDVPATFFLIGKNINEETAENMKRALELGCEIGNHSLTHSRMSQMDEEQVKTEILATSRMIEQITGHHYELDDFQIQAVTEGREAMGETIVRLRDDGRLYSGRGISTDIIGSGIRAYVNALNKIVYEED